MDARREDVRRRLAALGFDDVRFAAAAALPGAGLRGWLAAGMQADMAWMERTAEKRLQPDLVLPGARAVILLGVSYAMAAAPAAGPGRPVWARYALHKDYHDTIQPALAAAGRVLEEQCGAAGADYRCYIDTGPVLERGLAARAGLGFIGKNAMLISRRHGNWLFLAAILTRVEFEADEAISRKVEERKAEGGKDESGKLENLEIGNPIGLLCGKCTRCLEACPTQAFPRPGVVDARRCISYQTIENKGIIPRELRAGIGAHLYGCDVCLEVCPWNRFAREGRRLLLASRHDLVALTLPELLALTPGRFAAVFRRTAIKRLKLAGLLRNACVVAGNTGPATAPAERAEILAGLLPLAAHALPLVRAHAVWAVFRLGGGALLAAARAAETAALVLAEYAAEDGAGRPELF